MGSSKKHKDKDKDRDREHKRKRKHRSKSRSRSRSPHERERKHRRDEERKRRKEYLDRIEHYEEQDDRISQPQIKKETFDYDHGYAGEASLATGGAAGGSGGDSSLSIEETNKLRAKLGLDPLKIETVALKEEDKTGDEDVHVPAVNLAEQRKAEEMRQKLAQIREKRKINQKLGKVKTLGESDSEDDGILSWVKKNRKVQREKEMAEKRAQLLSEMDEEFGIGGLVQEAFGSTVKKEKEYSSKDLKGLKVQHKQDSFKEGQTIILTLEDKGVLDEEDDTLVNVNIMDQERVDKNLENKKKGARYKPWEEEESIDEYGMMKNKDVLDKYDEEIHGEKKESFELGSGGKYNAQHERRMTEIRAQLKQKSESLALPPPMIAKEYYSTTEMASFKKVKKKTRKIRKKPKMLKADDLVPLEDETNHGVRGREEVDAIDPEALPQQNEAIPGLDLVDMEIEPELDGGEILGPEEDLTGVVVDDSAQVELELSLKKARKLKIKSRLSAPEQVAEKVQQIERMDTKDDSLAAASNITMNSTAEFCRTLGEIPTYGMAGNREEDEEELLDYERELLEERKRQQEEDDGGTGWTQVDIDTRPVDIRDEEGGVLDEEPVIDQGMAGALALASKKGYLSKEKKKGRIAPLHPSLAAINYSIEDKRFDDIDDKYKKRERYSGGITVDFKELGNYKPDVKLEYVDDSGRILNPKEAFRQLSHRFHGKGSGKKKTEKRTKKLEEEQLMKQMSSTDTPLGTVALLTEKQKVEKTPFIVLSGGGKTMTSSTSLTKPN